MCVVDARRLSRVRLHCRGACGEESVYHDVNAVGGVCVSDVVVALITAKTATTCVAEAVLRTQVDDGGVEGAPRAMRALKKSAAQPTLLCLQQLQQKKSRGGVSCCLPLPTKSGNAMLRLSGVAAREASLGRRVAVDVREGP